MDPNKTDIPDHLKVKSLTPDQRALLEALNLDPDLVLRAMNKQVGRGGEDQTDWADVTKRALFEQQTSIMNQKHQTITGVGTKSVSKKSVGNKAILRELATVRENMDTALSSLHRHVNKLEAALDVERRQRHIMWIIMLYCLDTNQIQIPTMPKLLGWYLSRLDQPDFKALDTKLSELTIHHILSSAADVLNAKAHQDDRMTPGGGQFKTINDSYPVKRD